MKTIRILGSTGTIGVNTLDLCAANPEMFRVDVLTAHNNAELLIKQALALSPRMVVIGNDAHYTQVKSALSGRGIEVLAGDSGILQAASVQCDYTMAGIVGMAGLKPLIQAIENSKIVAIANKEPLVAAGALVMAHAKNHDCVLLPVDSEHNAIFQVFEPANKAQIDKIILTASGGPFLRKSLNELAVITPAQAVKHPNWSMGAKISVDSATMMNKALEVAEATVLFGLPPEKVDVMVHPQSLIHSMVVYADGSVLSQMGAPDMRTPIAHTLAWPQRMPTTGVKLAWDKPFSMEFEPADYNRFTALPLVYKALAEGQGALIAMNAANEVAVDAFLSGRISFDKIMDVVESHTFLDCPSALKGLDEIISFDIYVRERTKSYIV